MLDILCHLTAAKLGKSVGLCPLDWEWNSNSFGITTLQDQFRQSIQEWTKKNYVPQYLKTLSQMLDDHPFSQV